jgi:uncharacterized protein (TIGR00645 family)
MQDRETLMARLLDMMDKAILASRFVLLVFYFSLAAALGLYAIRYVWKLMKYASDLFSVSDTDYLLALLYMLDSALVAGLVVMVLLASYDSLVSRLAKESEEAGINWVAETDPGNLKLKLGVAIVAISGIHLLQVFLKVEDYSDRAVFWAIALHMTFLAGVLILALTDYYESRAKALKAGIKRDALKPPGDGA